MLLLYYITGRAQFLGNEAQRRRRLLEKIAEAARCDVDYIQLREKDLSARELETLACQAAQTIHESVPLRTENRQPTTGLLVNSRIDVALAAGAAGVHLRSNDISPLEARKIWQQCGAGAPSTPLRAGPAREISHSIPIVAVSCHSPEEVAVAARENANLAVFAPVFEKRASPDATPAGLESLRQACRLKISVFALGGITLQNVSSCVDAGAAGIAAIRLFQENDIVEVVRTLRG
jgi:thiamine-phosphate pyrophosphorylase